MAWGNEIFACLLGAYERSSILAATWIWFLKYGSKQNIWAQETITKELRKLHKEKIYTSYSLPNIISQIKNHKI
jgi:hypothetical protein